MMSASYNSTMQHAQALRDKKEADKKAEEAVRRARAHI